MLQHQYTLANISVQVLKNKDRAIVQVLQEAVRGKDFDLYVTLFNYKKIGQTDGGLGFYGNSLCSNYDEEYSIRSLINSDGERIDIKIPVATSGIILCHSHQSKI